MLKNDERYEKLARTLVEFSINLQKGERVLVNSVDIPDDMTIALIQAIHDRGGVPFLRSQSNKIARAQNKILSEEAFASIGEVSLDEMKKMQAFIAFRGGNNAFYQSDVAQEQRMMIDRIMRPVQDWRVQKTKWVILRWPSDGFAQQAKMSTDEFEDFFFRVCTMDYSRMEMGMAFLKKRMEAADRIQIVGNGTDLSFSIKGIPAIPCGGHHNIPDGEVFTAPVKNSVNGIIQYNTPTVYQGIPFENIRLEFRDGKIVAGNAGNKTNAMNKILDADEGSRYVGEFAFGLNPHILNPVCDILFDEKIAGSFHFTPGQAYEEADNGNRSQIHWDLVCIQRKECGGGEIYFDGELIRRDGLFIPTDLQRLNPENLIQD
ncbi:MAG: aminopeptidase [Puniceicoccales bacterium]|jgi:aminopeptidase|nr:aminopeptidase [Puniceicoccales bacterium]